MHREIVDTRRWVDERTFMQALNVCMLLPGPEAMQLAVWLGWRLHGTLGGVVAGICFILPSMAILLGLSFVYALHGELPIVAAALAGLKATVIALILQALVRIARRALAHPVHWLLALAAFALIATRLAPFPLVLAGAALAGLFAARTDGGPDATPTSTSFPWRTLAAGFALWAIPWFAILLLAGAESRYAGIYHFFSSASLVTF